MANSLDATLINQVLSAKGISLLQSKLAFLGNFSSDFSDEVRDQRSRTLNVPVYTATSAVQVNPTNFETGDTTSVNKPVTMDHISKSFYITSADFGKGSRLESLAEINMGVVAKQIENAVFTLITEANYGAPAVSGIVAGATSVANLKTLWGSLAGDFKSCVLKDTEFANFLPSDYNSFDVRNNVGAYGFDRFDRSGTGFAAAGTKLIGFAANRGAIAMASAIPEYTAQVAELLDSTVFEVPGLGISLQSNIWASAASRNTWASFDILFGCAVGDATQLKTLKLV